MKIDLDNQFITISDFQKIIAATQKILANSTDEQPELIINIKHNKFTEFDIALIGYLILCKQKKPNLSITLISPNPINKFESSALYSRLSSYDVYSQAIHGKKVFLIGYNNSRFIEQALDKNLQIHETFSPIIPVGKYGDTNCYEILFFGAFEINGSTDKHPDIKNKYHELGIQAFYKCLESAKIKACYEYEEATSTRTNYPQAGQLQPEYAKKYYDAIRPKVDKLKTKPIGFLFLFALILQNVVFPKYDKGKGQESYKDALEKTISNLWNFTERLFFSINELAKNISEHASTKQGIITLRAYNSTYIDQQKTNDEYKIKHFYDALDESKRDKMRCVIDINVFDFGDQGVIPTLIKKTAETIHSLNDDSSQQSFTGLLQEDIETLGKDAAGIHYLLSPTQTSLNQQQKRSLAHIGLMSLAALVQKNNGVIVASSTKESNGNDPDSSPVRDTFLNPNTEEASIAKLLNALPTTGTSYNILLPVLEDESYQSLEYSGLHIDRHLRASDIQAFDKLIELNPTTSSPKLSIINIIPPEAEGREAEREIISQVSEKININAIDSIQNAVCLNFDSIIKKKNEFTASQLFRIASTLEFLFSSLHFILFDLLHEWVEELIVLNEQFCKQNPNIDYWNQHKATIFISFIKSDDKRFYFTDVLYGKIEDDFYTINKIVSHAHFSSISLQKNIASINSECKLPNLSNHPAFINNCVMLPIDLILTHDGRTLFEHNASFLLQNDFMSKPANSSSDLIEIITNIQGFKIKDTHFRIGAKLHVEDFYFAKRIFQNSFYASRFAFLLAQKISLLLLATDEKQDGFTLIGYGMYSELLVSLTKKFLKKILDKSGKNELSNRINNDLVEDEEHLSIVKYKESKELYNNFIIIVPIASTFSTGFKIENALALEKQKDDPNARFSTIYLNVLLAYDEKQTDLQKSFGWEKPGKQNGIVIVLNPNDNKQSRQHYFLSVPTTWHPPTGDAKCPMCYDPDKEKALLSTDKTAVTPALVFGLPQVRLLSKEDKERISSTKISQDHITYGHHTRNDTHFLYSINIENFLSTNLTQIEKWLTTLYEKKLASPADEILIISECHHTNITFIDLVNEKIFLSSATILHFDSKNDSIDNFTLLYRDKLNKSKIFFVDDSLKSGNTFNRIYNFIFNALNSTAEGSVHKTRCIDGCITLLNKMQPKDEARIKSKLIQRDGADEVPIIFSFAHLHLFSSVDSMLSPPLEYDRKRYGILADRVVLDRFAVHFNRQREKVSPEEKKKKKKCLSKTDQAKPSENKEKNTPKEEMLWATHYIYDLFSEIHEDPENYNFENIFGNYESFIQKIDSKAQGVTTKDALLKVLTRSPFTQYNQIREKIFSWILTELKAHFGILEKQTSITDADIKIIKFYVRRITILNSSRILQERMLDEVLALLAKEIKTTDSVLAIKKAEEASPKQQTIFYNIPNQLESLTHKQGGAKDNLLDFCYFYGAQIAELLEQDTIRSLNLEKYLKNKVKDYNTLNLYQKKLIRLLFFENSPFIDNLWPLIEKMNWRTIYKEDINQKTISEDNGKITTGIIEESSIINNLRYKNLKDFFNNENPLRNTRYISYLWLRIFLSNQVKHDAFFPKKAPEYIMEKMINIFSNGQNNKIGGFFNVYTARQENQRPQTIYNNSNNSGGLRWAHESQDNALQALLDDLTVNTNKTVYVFTKEKGKWFDALEAEETKEIEPEKLSLLPQLSDILILVYLYQSESKKSQEKDKPQKSIQAILGFYSDPEQNPTPSEPYIKAQDWLESIRYILLLRKPISKFIAHYHENSMFSELKKAEEQKLTEILMGHGHDTISRFIENSRVCQGHFNEIPNTSTTFKMLERHQASGIERVQLFKQAFCAQGAITPITINEIGERYDKLAKEVCLSEYIEVSLPTEEMTVVTTCHNNSGNGFKYNYRILDLIMLELLINAKKNRWLFSDDENGNRKNFLWLNVSYVSQEKQLRIEIQNTGPGFSKEIQTSLNQGRPIKEPGRIAGTALIRHIFHNYLNQQSRSEDWIHFENADNRLRNHPAKVIASVTVQLSEFKS